MANDTWNQALTYLFSSIKTLLLRILILLIFGSAFLFLTHSLCDETNVCGLLKISSLDFIKIDLSNQTNTVRSLVFSYIAGLLLYAFGVWCFRFFRKLKLESYIVKGWKIEKVMEENGTMFNKINDAEINNYLEKHPYVADIYTIEQFHSTITRPIFSIFVLATLLFFPQERYILLILVSTIIFLVAVGLSADKEANAFGTQIKEALARKSK